VEKMDIKPIPMMYNGIPISFTAAGRAIIPTLNMEYIKLNKA
jgi:hypothetical protein